MRLLAFAACAACGRIDFALHDAAPDALGMWGPATPVFNPSGDENPTLTNDMLELYFARNNNIFVAKRTSLADAWSSPTLVMELKGTNFETIPEVSGDGLAIYFLSDRLGGEHVFMATRVSRADVWSGIVQLPQLETAGSFGTPVVSDDGLSFVSPADVLANGNADLYTGTRATTSSSWSMPVPLASVNSSAYDSDPFMIADQLTLYFRSDRDGAADLFVTTRESVADAFSTPVPIAELNTPGSDSDPWVSPDQRTIYFASGRSGVDGLYMAIR